MSLVTLRIIYPVVHYLIFDLIYRFIFAVRVSYRDRTQKLVYGEYRHLKPDSRVDLDYLAERRARAIFNRQNYRI